MNDFFSRQAARALGVVPSVTSQMAPRFASVDPPASEAREFWSAFSKGSGLHSTPRSDVGGSGDADETES